MAKGYLTYLKNVIVYFGASLIPMVLNLVANPWVARNMAPEDYAISGYYTSFSGLISPLIIFNMVLYYINEYYRRDEEGRERLYAIIAKATIWFSGAVALICFIGLLIYLNFIVQDLSVPIMPYLAFMVFALPLTGLMNLRLAKYRMEKDSFSYFKLGSFNGILNVFTTILFVVWLKWGAFGKLLGPLVCNGTVFLIMLYLFRDVFKIKTSLKEFKPIFIFCLPLALSAMLGYFTNGFTTTYLESLGDNREYGYYVVGASIAAYLTTCSEAVWITFQPDIYESTIKRQWGRYIKSCAVPIVCYIALAGLFVALAPIIIRILTDGLYMNSVPYARIIAFGVITSGLYHIVTDFSIATNRPKLFLYTSILGSLAMIFLLPKFTDRWGYYGGAWMSVISFVIFTIINLILLFIIKNKKG